MRVPVKGNTRACWRPWRLAWPGPRWGECLTEDVGRGRIERRTLPVATLDPEVDGIDLPCAAQAWRLRRDVLGMDRMSKRSVFGITCRTRAQAGPAELATLIRGRWAAGCVHWPRGVPYREDSCPFTRSAAQAMPRSVTSSSA